jgi:hypothetical protein
VVQSLEEIRAERPSEVGVARAMVIAAVVLWVPVTGHLYPGSTSGAVALMFFFAVFGSFGAVKGRQAGRTMVTVALGLACLFMLPYCWLGFSDPYLNGPGYALLDMASVALSAVAVVLLYQPNTNRYLRRVTAARQRRS